MRPLHPASLLLGAAGAVLARGLTRRALLARFRRDLAALNDGDYRPLLSAYADDAVLHFNDGPHRWAGEHRGRVAIERFLREFTNAGLRGELLEVWIAGPPWALTMVARFDDRAAAPDGSGLLYENRTAIVIRTRRGRIVEQHDFYEDTSRILALEQALRERGVRPAGLRPAS
jgi:ketosteroid isomerase-like protein